MLLLGIIVLYVLLLVGMAVYVPWLLAIAFTVAVLSMCWLFCIAPLVDDLDDDYGN